MYNWYAFGQVIYVGVLGQHPHMLVEFFESISGIPKCKDSQNPATWMLEISSEVAESKFDVDFAEIYEKSVLNRYAVFFNY